ncbi:MAG: DUF2513 domain-containing protein [Rhodobacteraceae bacterium]|nr:DUF2513 domain-containing protein [Paracoccaceae bacterium]
MPKRDLDRMRELLMIAEEFEAAFPEDDEAGLVDMDSAMDARQDILDPRDEYQLWLMERTGWIDVPNDWIRLFRITPLGHDYLDAVRDEGIWAQTKKAVADTGGNATIEIVKALATGYLKKKISQHTGIQI